MNKMEQTILDMITDEDFNMEVQKFTIETYERKISGVANSWDIILELYEYKSDTHMSISIVSRNNIFKNKIMELI